MVTRTEGGEWKIVDVSDISNNIPKAIPFTVAAGEPNGGGYGLALTSFTPSKTTVSQNELFVVSSALKNVTLEAFPGGQIGTALVDNNGNIKAIIGSRNRSALNPGSTSSAGDAYSYVPSSIAPGQYKLKIAVKPTDSEEWKIAMAMPDIPNSINFTVTPAEKGAPGGGYGLALTAFTTNKTTVSQSELINSFATNKTSVSQNELFTVNSTLRNVAQNAFLGGQIGTALVDNNGNIVEVIKTINYSSLNSGSSRTSTISNCAVPNTVTPGRYKLKIVVKPTDGEWQIATLSLPDAPNSIDFEVK
jgi:hypothetical protein